MKKLSPAMVALISGTFLSAPVLAIDVNVDYLSSLTGPKISWSDSEGTEVTIGDKTFYYTYNMPDDYQETSTRIDDTLNSENAYHKLFKDIIYIGRGGAIYNSAESSSYNIISDFIGNITYADFPKGGGIHNIGALGDINGVFINNATKPTTDNGSGLAIYNGGSINSTGGTFLSHGSNCEGDCNFVIYNTGTIGSINASFIANNKVSISNTTGNIDKISGNFVGNTDNIIQNLSGTITKIENSNFINNIGNVVGNVLGTITEIENSNFINNNGMAIYVVSPYPLTITANNAVSLFSGNYVETDGNKKYTSLFLHGIEQPLDLNLKAINNGQLIFDDAISAEDIEDVSGLPGYNINVYGDGTGVVKFNNEVRGITNFTLGANSITHLGLNSKVYAQDMNINTSAIPGGNAVSSPIITVDVEVDKANNTINTGQIYVDNDIEGDYRVLVNSLNPDVLDSTEDAVVPFLFAPEDDTTTSSSFSVARVIGSPYMWDGSVNAKGEDTGSTWYLNLTDEENPDYVPPEPEPEPDPEPQPKPSKIYAPEVIAGIGLHEAAIEQTRSVVSNVRNKTSGAREYCDSCTGMYSYEWDGKKLRNIWALAQGESANIDKPVDMEAKIWGIEAGFDVQSDLHNTLGVFASYRKGQYDLSGKGSKLHSNIGSEIDINSYLAGLYYRYDHNFNWLFGTIYGGMQEAEVETEDHIAKFDTDGIEFGASIEIGRTIPLARDLTLDPSVGLYYTQVNFDDADDNVGKHYEWDDIKHLEAELSAKLEKQFDNAKVYIKPSVIQTLTDDDSVIITGLSKADTYHDQTLGRIEIGGRYGFTDALSAYAWANYTFGSSYDAYALGAGLNYAW